MRIRFLLVLVIVIGFVSASSAQTKASGTLQCAKADPVHTVEIADRPNHSFVLSKLTCTWSKPMDIGGSQSKEGVSTESDEMNGNKATSNGGVHWGTTANGDKYFVKYQGSTTYKDGAVVTLGGTWKYTGGTGALKGLQGKGTYKGTGSADGSSTTEVEGEYSLPKAKEAKKK